MGDLTDRERAILDLEGRWYRYAGAKEAAVRDELGVSLTRYSQELRALVRRPEALAYAPTTVRRVQRLARDRARQRSARRLDRAGV